MERIALGLAQCQIGMHDVFTVLACIILLGQAGRV